MTTLSNSRRIASQPHGFARFVAAWQAWRLDRQTRKALESLSDEQLKDIGYRRVPVDPPHYDRLW